MSPTVCRATVILYRAAYSAYTYHKDSIHAMWQHSEEELPSLYRHIIDLEFPTLARMEVKAGTNNHARGCCLGISKGSHAAPYMYLPPKFPGLVNRIIYMVRASHPLFRFTSMQVNVGLCSGLHVDQANTGGSLVIGLGPHVGSLLTKARW